MKEPRKKAIELMKHYYVIVYPYVGSDFMTGTENNQLKFKSSRTESIYLVDHMLSTKFPYEPNNVNVKQVANKHLLFWAEVRNELEIMTQEQFEAQL